jgi:AraC-like DNA-binding protein
MNLLSTLAASGLGLGLVIILALAVRRDANRQANYCLAASMACSMNILLLVLLLQVGALEHSPGLRVLALPYILATPFLYAYTRLMTKPDHTPGYGILIHLWPLLIALLPLFSASDLGTESFDRARGGWPPNSLALLAIFSYGVQVFYLTWSLRLVLAHGTAVSQSFSYREWVSLRWLRILISLYLALVVFGLLVALARLVPGIELWPRAVYSSSMTVAICYLIAFFGITQGDVFGRGESESENHGESVSEKTQASTSRYESSGLTPELEHDYWRRLEAHMREHEPYLDHELRIANLAHQLEVPVTYLSQAINRQAGQNFFDYVSRYRVARALELLQGGDANIARVAQESGFNSQSAFYRQFKKATSLTPKQYQRQAGEQKDQNSNLSR